MCSSHTNADFRVIQGCREQLLSKKTAIKLSVLKVGANISIVTDVKSEIQKQYLKMFQGVGKVSIKQISLHIDKGVT